MTRVAKGLQLNANLERPGYRLQTGSDQIRLSALGQISLTSMLAAGSMADSIRVGTLALARDADIQIGDMALITGTTMALDSGGGLTAGSGGTRTTYCNPNYENNIPEDVEIPSTTTETGSTWYDMPGDWSPDEPYVPPPPPPPPPVYTPPPTQSPWAALGMTWKEYMMMFG